jgi:hypothetical protein
MRVTLSSSAEHLTASRDDLLAPGEMVELAISPGLTTSCVGGHCTCAAVSSWDDVEVPGASEGDAQA